jgi:hypothetical protein
MRPSGYHGLMWNNLDLNRGTAQRSHTREGQKVSSQFAETKRPPGRDIA